MRLSTISFRAGREIGMDTKDLVLAFRRDSFRRWSRRSPILVSVVVLIPRLGVPFPWMRLSVIGSVIYELLGAGIAASEMGLEGLSGAFDGTVYSLAVWTMSMGFIFCLLFVAFATPHLKKSRIGWLEGTRDG